MSEIYVFSPFEEDNDYSSFGLVGALTPTSCSFKEQANGDSAVELAHPLDEYGRYLALEKDNILLVPVPVRMTPEIDNEECVTTVWTYKVRDLSVLTNASQRTLFKNPTGSGKLKVLDAGALVTVVLKETDGEASERWKVKSEYGTGWMMPDGLTLVEEHIIEDNSQAIEEVSPAWQVKPQLFRIYEVVKSITDVKVAARHISYDLLYNVTSFVSNEAISTQAALTGILANTYAGHGFVARSNVANEQPGLNWRGKTPIDAFLDPESGVCKLFDVSIIRDNYELFFLHDPGMNRGVRIEYAKNMTGVDYKESTDELVTRIVPVGKNSDGSPLYLPNTPYIDSPRIGDYPTAHVYYMECDNCKVGDKEGNGKITVDIALQRMQEQALALFADESQEVDKPKIEVSVTFQSLGDTEEYAQFRGLENCYLYDYVRIVYPRNGIDTLARITEIEWDCLLNRMKSVEIGRVKNGLATGGFATWQVPSGMDGKKIATGTADGTIIKEGTVIFNALHEDAVVEIGDETYTQTEAKLASMISGETATDSYYGDLVTIAQIATRYGTEIPANTDLNNAAYLTSGAWFATAANAATLTNSPTSLAFAMWSVRADGSNYSYKRTVQLVQELSTPSRLYVREHLNGTFRSWRQMATMANVDDAESAAKSYADTKDADVLTSAKAWAGNAETNTYQLGSSAGSNTVTVTGCNNNTHNGFAVLLKRSYTVYAMILVDLWTQNIGIVGKLPAGIRIAKDSGNTHVIKIQNGAGATVVCVGLNCSFESDDRTSTLTENVTRYCYEESLADAAELAAKSYTDTEAAKKINAYGAEISSGDLNDYKTSGHYFFTAATAANLSHCPTGVGGVLLVFRGDASTNTTSQRTVQIVYEVATPHKAYMRAHYNGSWRDWQTVVFSTDLASAISGMLTTSDVANNLTTTESGKVLDARQGKALADEVTARAVTDKVRKTMRVGARNLLIDTQEMNLTATDGTTWRTGNGTGEASRYAGTDGFYRIKLFSSGATADTSVSGYSPRLSLGADWTGKKLTFSMDVWANNWAQVDQGCRIYFMVNAGDQSWTYYSAGRLICKTDSVAWGDDIVAEKTCHSQQWLRVATTIELTEANFPNGSHSGLTFSDMTDVFVLVRLTRNGDVRFCRPKLEWGEIDTDWSPAPSDLEDHAEGYADGVGASTLQSVKDYLGKVPTNIYQLGSSSGSNTVTVTGSANDNNNGFAVLVKRSYTSYAVILVDLWTQNIGIIGKLPTSLKITKDSGNTRTIQLQNGTGAAVVCIGLNCTFTADSTTSALTENVTRYNYEESLLEGIGDTTSESPNAVTVANETVTNLASVTLAAGTYILEGVASFGANATGYRQLGFGSNATSSNRDRFAITRVGACSGVATAIQVVMPIKVTSSTTLYLNGYQNSGGSLTVTGGIRYTKIR